MRYLRHAEVLRRLRDDGPLTVEQLSSAVSVSPATMRRDLDLLARDGHIDRIRGGAILRPASGIDADAMRPFAAVAAADVDDKMAIAAQAATMVEDGATIALDIGTTTMLLARALRGRPITVVTASLAVIDELRDDLSVELIVLGGYLRRNYHSLVGSLTEDALRQVRATTVFFGASGVLDDGTVLDTTAVEVPVKRQLIRAAERVVLLADRHKFPGSGSLRVCGAGEVDEIVTNRGVEQRTLAALRAVGLTVRTV